MKYISTFLAFYTALLATDGTQQKPYDMQMFEGKSINTIQCLTQGSPDNPESAIAMFQLNNGCKAVGIATGDAGLSTCNIKLDALYCGESAGKKIYGWILGSDKAMGIKGEAQVLVSGSQNKYITIPANTDITAVIIKTIPQEE